MVGGMGRAALYLKVSPAGFGLRPDHVRWPDLHADATQPATGHLDLSVLSLPFPLISVNSDQFPRFEPHFLCASFLHLRQFRHVSRSPPLCSFQLP